MRIQTGELAKGSYHRKLTLTFVESVLSFGDNPPVKLSRTIRRFLPVTARFQARLLGSSTIPDCASEIIELAPAVDRVQPPAIALPGEFDRVVAVQEETTPAMERERLREGNRRHAPTIAYRMDGAVLAGGTLYYGDGFEVIRKSSKRLILNGHWDHFAEMQLCSGYVIERYFGHWATDGLALELLAAQRSVPGLKPAGTPWMHEPGYRELCGLPVTRSDNAWVDRLWVIDDRGTNDGWISRIEEVRRRVRSAAAPNGPKRVMLTRGTLGAKRSLINSSQVHEALIRLGFDIVHPELETARGLAEKLCGVEIAIAVEGSAQDHCWLAMPPQSTFVAIQPPTRFNTWAKMTADAVGINFAFVVADSHPDGFCLPTDRLLRTIDEVMRAAASRHS